MIWGTGDQTFPLSVSASGRYLQTAGGRPFFLFGDTPWSIEVQLSDQQIKFYLDYRKSQGFNCILFQYMEHKFSDQSPAYKNADGDQPLTTMTTFSSGLVTPYKNRVKFIVDQCKCRQMACMINPCYLGSGGGDEGWMSEVTADTAGHLQTFGADVATLLNQGNVIWCMGGDYAGTTTERDKQWNIVTGIRTVRTTDLITGHPARADGDAWTYWGAGGQNYTGFNLNAVYTDAIPYTETGNAWGRAGPLPCFLIESYYENENSSTNATLRKQNYQAWLSGCCGVFYGCGPVWDFGSPTWSGGGVLNALSRTNLATTAVTEYGYFKSLVTQYNSHLLVPKTDTSLVTTSLGSGTGRIIPALAPLGRPDNNNDVAMIYTPSVDFTVQMTNFTQSSVRGRWYDPTTGTFSTASGSPYTNSGTHAFTNIGERVLVLD